jgi:hypothetical protein
MPPVLLNVVTDRHISRGDILFSLTLVPFWQCSGPGRKRSSLQQQRNSLLMVMSRRRAYNETPFLMDVAVPLIPTLLLTKSIFAYLWRPAKPVTEGTRNRALDWILSLAVSCFHSRESYDRPRKSGHDTSVKWLDHGCVSVNHHCFAALESNESSFSRYPALSTRE